MLNDKIHWYTKTILTVPTDTSKTYYYEVDEFDVWY